MPFPGFRLDADVDGPDDKHVEMDISALDDSPAVPLGLLPILDKTAVQEAAEFLRALLDEVTSTSIDNESSYEAELPAAADELRNEFPNIRPDMLTVSSWASGGGHEIFGDMLYRFTDEEHTTFFQNIFNAVKGKIPAATFGRNNFFHGHSVFDMVDGSGDFRIVFHAFEYPADLQAPKSRQALSVDHRGEPFDHNNSDFYRRNAIWSMRNNTLYIPDYGEDLYQMSEQELEDYLLADHIFPYIKLLDLSADGKPGCRMDQAKVGVELIAFNYFPSEGVNLFLKQS